MNTHLVNRFENKNNLITDDEFDERSTDLMIQYFLEDEEYQELFRDLGKLSSSSLRLISMFMTNEEFRS